MKAAVPSSRFWPLVPVPGLPHRHMIRPHLLTKKQVMSTASSSSTKTPTRMPAITPMGRFIRESSLTSAGESRQSRGDMTSSVRVGGLYRGSGRGLWISVMIYWRVWLCLVTVGQDGFNSPAENTVAVNVF